MLGKKEAADDVSRLFFHLATTVLFSFLLFFTGCPLASSSFISSKLTSRPRLHWLLLPLQAGKCWLMKFTFISWAVRLGGGRRGRSLQLLLGNWFQLIFSASPSMVLSSRRHKMETTRRRRRTLFQKVQWAV